jgi:aminopeptidase N
MFGLRKDSIFKIRGVVIYAPLFFWHTSITILLAISLSSFYWGKLVLAEPLHHALWEGKSQFSWNGLSLDKQVLSDSVHSFNALHYRLDLDFTSANAYFTGSMILRFEVVDLSISQLRLNMAGLVADSAFVSGLPAFYARDDTSILVDLSGNHLAGETLSVKICYHDTLDGRGFYHFDRNSYSMAEPQDARYWFPCYDEPWDKATSEIFAIVPIGEKVGSNGYLESVTPDSANQKLTYHWVNNYPIATYLISVIIGDFAVWNDYYIRESGDSIPIYNMVWREDSLAAAYDFALTPQMMAIYSNLFGPYPFNKYGQGVVAPFNYGGMENQTMTTFNRSWITGNRQYEFGYAHELAHMWWGDYVTLSDWRQTWLNEGFANYSSALYNEAQYGHEAFLANMIDYRNDYFTYEQSAGRFPLFDPPDIFGLNVYLKGAWVLHMLRGVVGDQVFFDGLKSYARQYAYGNASTWDFKNVMESRAGIDLNFFFNEWVFEQGYPEYNYAWNYQPDGDSFRVHLEIAQVQSNAPIFDMPIEIRIIANDNINFIMRNNESVQAYDIMVSSRPDSLLFDPDQWILKRANQVTSIGEPQKNILPDLIEIRDIYPNPFNSSALIQIAIGREIRQCDLSIFDIQGRKIRSLMAGKLQPSLYSVTWDGKDNLGDEITSGVYFIRLSTDSQAQTAKIIYIR